MEVQTYRAEMIHYIVLFKNTTIQSLFQSLEHLHLKFVISIQIIFECVSVALYYYSLCERYEESKITYFFTHTKTLKRVLQI